MDVYVARQPIFDKEMNVFGYELLYRKSMNNFYEGYDDNKSTAELITNSFLAMQVHELTGGSKAFINFSQQMLLHEIPMLLSKEMIVVEILERVEITDELVMACKRLKKNGYILALDDFIFQESYLPLLEIADIIKIEFQSVSYEEQEELIRQYRGKIKFLAEKVETREEYQRAIEMGYDYFQGYFFSKPVILKGKEIDGFNVTLVRVINELNATEPDYQRVTEIIETDLGLSYKLLKLANSVFFTSRQEIYSIKKALIRLGTSEIKKWIYLMLLKDIQNIENKELIKTCLIRAKLMELIAIETGQKQKYKEYFMTGMFSAIDVLLHRNMFDCINELLLPTDVTDALLGCENENRKVLDFILKIEQSSYNEVIQDTNYLKIEEKKFLGMYIEALKWGVSIDA